MDDRPDGIDDTVIRPRVAPALPPATPPDVADTVIRLVEAAAPQSADALPVDRASLDAALAEGNEQAAPQPAAWAMHLRGTSIVVPLDAPAIIGRRPGPVRAAEQPVPRRVVIPPDRVDVSARHARIEQLGASLVVTDLGSTNGVVVHWSRGASRRLRSRESCAVLPDAVIVLGDGVEIEFVALPVPPIP